MPKNSYLKKLQLEQDKKVHDCAERMAQWTMQAAVDALILILGYGDCMGKDPWGEKRISVFLREWGKEFWEVFGAISNAPDADATRERVDRLMKGKIKPEEYTPWEERYSGWLPQTLEQEAAQNRGKWRRDGMDTQDRVTGNGLRVTIGEKP